MIVEASAPVRIDLAGGGFDVYPLYAFEGGGVTINVGIDIRTNITLKRRTDEQVIIRSTDLDITEHVGTLNAIDCTGQLGFIARIVDFYKPATGLDIITTIDIPKGSGLGTSSSLLISLTGALNALNNTDYSAQQMIDLGASIEAQNLKVPTGKQDYYGACYGWFNAVWSEMQGCRNERLELSRQRADELNERIVLSFTGQPHFSGATNWALVKGYIDNIGQTRQTLRNIQRTGFEMYQCLKDGAQTNRLVELINQEWENRKNCAEGVTNDKIEKIIAAAKDAGALVSKLCGAGAGGCMISFVEPENKQNVIDAIQACGSMHMPYKIATEGLRVSCK